MLTADFRRICCAVDFSDTSRGAMEVAVDLARRLGAEVTLLHAYPIPGYTFPDGSVVASPGMLQDLSDQADRHLEAWRRDAEAMGLAHVAIAKAIGDPSQEIARWAKEQKVDLLVLGTHGRSGLEHALMGSIAERVLRKAPCPVLTIRPR